MVTEPGRGAPVGALVSGLVHEVRNPLNAIRTNLEILGEDLARMEPGDGPHVRRVARLLGEVDRLNRILTDFLEYARGPEISPKETDLVRLLAETVTLIEPEAERAHVSVLAELPDRALLARVDPHAMKQVFLNLAMNALQAMPHGGTLMLRLRPGAPSGGEIEVADTGSGISPGDLPRIFDLFFTNRPGGTGIGLAVVKRLVEAHGGSVEVQSDPGRGSLFRIHLP